MIQNSDLLSRLKSHYKELYSSQNVHQYWEDLEKKLIFYHKSRPNYLKKMDLNTRWFQSENMVGMTLYVDLFSKNLVEFINKVTYFKNLGITYIHLMPLLKSRPGNNDGGYAVADFKDIEPNLGTMADFEAVIKTYQDAGIAIAIDFVINHTAKEHRWAQAALKGDVHYQQYFMMYDDEKIPNEFNRTVPEVLPDIYPGNFTYYPEIKKFVFKSFSEFQWDLNFNNPLVLNELIDIFLFYANKGVSLIRLDAIPFIWKELNTTCRNLPKAHEFIAFFQLVKQFVCPGVVILGEAIVEPNEIFKYFGFKDKIECDMLYNATLMVNIWEALATQDGRLLITETNRFPLPKHASWINYVRCHDDIGWGFNESYIQSTGREPYMHKQFLINFYNGKFHGSFARGVNYQENPRTHDARTNGTLASLLGFEQFFKSEKHDNFAMNRFKLFNALIFTMPGAPLIYSGDEWLQLNDYNHSSNPGKEDGRWIHRNFFNWNKVIGKYNDPAEKDAFELIKKLIQIRKRDSRFHTTSPIHVLEDQPQPVFAFSRGLNKLLYCFFNFSPNIAYGFLSTEKNQVMNELISGENMVVKGGQVPIPPYSAFILI